MRSKSFNQTETKANYTPFSTGEGIPGSRNRRLTGVFAWILVIFVPGLTLAQTTPLAPTPGLTRDQVHEGWISLFDGSTLYGWKPVSNANWQVESGEIRVSEGERGLLRTTSQFDDFEMTVDFKAAPRTNSGIFLRTSPRPKSVTGDCYELNIASALDHDFPTGSLVGRAKCSLDVADEQWHRFRILADGPSIKVWLDDAEALDYVDPRPLGRGYIGLQLNSGAVAFRNISIKPLKLRSIFDGKSLERWNLNNRLESDFKTTPDGELQILNGKGQLETEDQYGDFVMSLACKTKAAGLNSGVFFRCIPGEVMNGYESQIQNQFKQNDRTQPVDCGTGGIFRRTSARLVNANDQEWFVKTIIATGPHISVWVNGFQVTDWSDTRSPDANPRRGRRLEKGTIILQGHDPTTDILFKNLRAKEITARRPAIQNP